MTAEVGDLNARVIRLLTDKGLRVSTAESCTGGLLAALLTDAAGASEALEECIVTYSNEAKMRELGVKASTLERFGAVSAETAEEMCVGICLHTGAEVGIGITGIAGPGGGTPEKPVGTVCVGICVNGAVTVSTEHFEGDRAKVREGTCVYALKKVLELLN